MIRLDILVMGLPNKTLVFQNKDKKEAKDAYCKHMDTDRVSCYVQVTVHGKPLTLAEARKFFGLPPIIRHVPRKAETESAFPQHRRRR